MWSHTNALWAPGTKPHHNILMRNVGACVYAQAAVCPLLVLRLCRDVCTANHVLFQTWLCLYAGTCAHPVLFNVGIHVFAITTPAFQHHRMSPRSCTASQTVSLIDALLSPLPPPSPTDGCSALAAPPRRVKARTHFAPDCFLIVYISGCTPCCRCLYSSPCSVSSHPAHTEMRHTYNRGRVHAKRFHPDIFWKSQLFMQGLGPA